MARPRNASGTQAVAPPPNTRSTRAALKEKTNTTRHAPTYENDGDTEALVKEAKPRRGRPKKASPTGEAYTMRGGLGSSDAPATENPAQTDAAMSTDPLARVTSDVAPSTDPLAKSDEAEAPQPKGRGRPARTKRKIAQSEAQTKMFAGMRQRMEATAKGETARQNESAAAVPPDQPTTDTPRAATKKASGVPAASTNERSDLSLSPSPPRAGKLSTVKGHPSMAPGSTLRVQGTPAIDTSILKNFKRRPRQQSMLQMVKQRTSLAHQQSQMLNDESVYDLEDLDDDVEDEFAPEAEGTPLRANKTRRQSSAAKKTAPKSAQKSTPLTEKISKKRKSDDVTSSTSALDALHAKRRKSAAPVEEDVVVEDSQKNKLAKHPPEPVRESPPKLASGVQVIGSSPIPSSPLTEASPAREAQHVDDGDAVVPSTEEQQAETHNDLPQDLDPGIPDDDQHMDPLNSTMADPASSSPPPEAARPLATQRTDIFADPITQRTPSPRRETRKKKASPKPLTTAKLQALLPKRRAKRQPARWRTEFDLPSGSEDENEEPSDSERETRTRRKTKTKVSAGKTSKAASKTKPKTRTAQNISSRKTTAPQKSPAATTKPKRTYGRKDQDKENSHPAASDDEEEGEASVLPDTTMSSLEVSKSAELEAARRKFAEIDQWDMEFESLGGEEHRSSSQGWR
ncbi:hypothetical protein MBLNU230_g3293t1 [Neophaeotheca triangularis]